MDRRTAYAWPGHILSSTPERVSTSPRIIAGSSAIVESPSFVRAVGELEGEKLQRVPRGFDANHPAAEYLKFRQFLAGCEYPAAFATSPQFYAGTLKVFRAIAPLVKFLNEPLLGR